MSNVVFALFAGVAGLIILGMGVWMVTEVRNWFPFVFPAALAFFASAILFFVAYKAYNNEIPSRSTAVYVQVPQCQN